MSVLLASADRSRPPPIAASNRKMADARRGMFYIAREGLGGEWVRSEAARSPVWGETGAGVREREQRRPGCPEPDQSAHCDGARGGPRDFRLADPDRCGPRPGSEAAMVGRGLGHRGPGGGPD